MSKLIENDVLNGLNQDNLDIYFFKTVDSTNVFARKTQLNKPFLIVLAEQQTAGKGRHGKTWHSPESGNIYLSIKYQAASMVPALSLIIGLLIAEALDETSGQKINAQLKWPNDVLMDGCKVAGILLETCGIGPSHLNIGIGVNLSILPESDKIETLSTKPICLGIEILPMDFLTILANFFAIRLKQFNTSGFKQIRLDWLKSAANIGKVITARMPNSEITGKFVTVDEQGAIVLQADDMKHTIHAADIFF